MKNSISTIGSGLLVSVSLTIATTAASAQSIQYGGDWEHLVGTDAQDANWRAAVGADQVIQWNGVNSVNQNFGNAGTLNNQGAGATLTSLGSENIVLTTRGLSSTDTDGLLTFSTGRPQILGINSDNDNNAAQFESNFSEIWTFDFSKDVVFEQMVANAMGFDGETFGIDIGADGSYEYEWNRTGFTTGTGTVVAVSFGAADEYLATFGSGFSVPAGTDIAIAGLAGSIGIEALVISVPEPSSYALFAGILAMTGVVIRRRR